jgi:hypothetical protein
MKINISNNAKRQLFSLSKRYSGKFPYALNYIDSITINPIYLAELEVAGLVLVDRMTKPTPLSEEEVAFSANINQMMGGQQ